MGTGTMDEAQAWVEYCNGGGETYWSQLRINNGHAEPYGVKYWGLGNEVYGPWQVGYKSASSYAEQAREYAKFVRWTDRDVRLIACGGGDPEWDWDGAEDRRPLHRLHLVPRLLPARAGRRPVRDRSSHAATSAGATCATSGG